MENTELTREHSLTSNLLSVLESWMRDLRFALRLLAKSPGFTAMAVLSLGLGIGASTIVFTVLRQVVLASLPVPQPERLFIFHNKGTEQGHVHSDSMNSSFSYPVYRDLNAGTKSIFDGILGRFETKGVLSREQSSELVTCELVSGNYFDVLKVHPWRGRLLNRSDDLQPNAHPLLVLSYGYWQRSFGGDANIIGKSVRMNNHPYVVVGIAPPQFYGLDLGSPPDVFVPMMKKAQITTTWNGLLDRSDHWCNLVGRLKNNVELPRATSALNVIYKSLRKQDLAEMDSPSAAFRSEFAKNYIALTPGGKGYAEIRETLRDPLQFLTFMVGILLLITIVNVANLLIARAAARQREIAIRLSVGASKGTLIRQLLVESLMLAVFGGALGVLLSYTATPILLRFLSSSLSESSIHTAPDWYVLLFVMSVSLCSGLCFGLLPAWQASRTDVGVALKTDGAPGHTGEKQWLRRTLVAAQIGFSLVLLSAAMLFSRSLSNIKNLNTGLRTKGLLTFKVNPAAGGYSQTRVQAFGEEVRQRLAGLHDIEAAAIATVPLLENDDQGSNITVMGYKAPTHADEETRMNDLSPDFFRTMNIPLLQGRSFRQSDLLPGSHVVVVNATFARHFFGDRNPIGGHFGFGGGNVKTDWTIVGVVADNQHTSLRSKIEPYVYLPYGVKHQLGVLTFYVRTRGSQAPAMREIRTVVKHYDANLPVYDLRSLEQTIDEGLFAERGLQLLSIVFAGLAVLLAVVGLYGVMSYSVARRRREFGVRMAVGATPRNIVMMMLREAAVVGIVGVLFALPFVFAVGQLIGSSLYGVSAHDPVIVAAAALLLLTTSILAGAVPAAQAANTDPQGSLRAE